VNQAFEAPGHPIRVRVPLGLPVYKVEGGLFRRNIGQLSKGLHHSWAGKVSAAAHLRDVRLRETKSFRKARIRGDASLRFGSVEIPVQVMHRRLRSIWPISIL